MEDNKQKRYEKPKMPRSPLFWVLVALLGLLLISTTLSTSSYPRKRWNTPPSCRW